MSLRRDATPGSSGKTDLLKRMFDEKAAFQGLVGTIEDVGVVQTDPDNPKRLVSSSSDLAEWIKDFKEIVKKAKREIKTSKALVLFNKANQVLFKIMIQSTGRDQYFYVWESSNGFEPVHTKTIKIDEESSLMIYVMNSAVFRNATSLTEMYWSFMTS